MEEGGGGGGKKGGKKKCSKVSKGVKFRGTTINKRYAGKWCVEI